MHKELTPIQYITLPKKEKIMYRNNFHSVCTLSRTFKNFVKIKYLFTILIDFCSIDYKI